MFRIKKCFKIDLLRKINVVRCQNAQIRFQVEQNKPHGDQRGLRYALSNYIRYVVNIV